MYFFLNLWAYVDLHQSYINDESLQIQKQIHQQNDVYLIATKANIIQNVPFCKNMTVY